MAWDRLIGQWLATPMTNVHKHGELVHQNFCTPMRLGCTSLSMWKMRSDNEIAFTPLLLHCNGGKWTVNSGQWWQRQCSQFNTFWNYLSDATGDCCSESATKWWGNHVPMHRWPNVIAHVDNLWRKCSPIDYDVSSLPCSLKDDVIKFKLISDPPVKPHGAHTFWCIQFFLFFADLLHFWCDLDPTII